MPITCNGPTTSLYQQVRDHVVSLIIDDVLKSGDPIPSVRQMAVEGGVNPLTVSRGLPRTS